MRVLVVGAHPDDQEIGMGGTIALLATQGHDVLLLDLTDGEPTPFGNHDMRMREAAHAASILGVERLTLDFPNRWLACSIEARHRVASVIREHRTEVVFAQYAPDAHPDHIAGSRIVEAARFDAKLTKTDLPGEPIYPKWLFYYYCLHIRAVISPSFLIDVTPYQAQKLDAVFAYESQVEKGNRGQETRDRLTSSHGYFGRLIGVKAAEPFRAREPIGLASIDSLPLD